MTLAKNTKKETAILAFPSPEDWNNIVHDLKLTKTQVEELEVVIRYVIATIETFRAGTDNLPQRRVRVAALNRLEEALGRVQSEMTRSKDLLNHFLPNNTVEFIGKSFTFTAIGQAVKKNVFPIQADYAIQSMLERNNFITLADLENHFSNDRIALGFQYGGEILRHFIDVIYADLKTWVELQRYDTGGRPVKTFRNVIIRRLAEASELIVGKRATTTPGGKFAELCIAVLPACGFSSEGIEKAIERVLEKTNGNKKTKKRQKHKA